MTSAYLRIIFILCCVVLISHCSEDPSLPQDTSDTTPPSVVSTSPTDDATGVSVNTTISATFSEDLNPSTVKNTTFLVSNGATGTVSYNDKVATFTLDAALDSFTVYEATLTTGIEDEAGNELPADYAWSFRTLSSQENQPPVADAGPDQDVNKENVVTLDGSGSSDPEDATLTYKWTQVLGPDVTGGSGELAGESPTFTAPSEVSTVQFDLVVNDGINDSDPAHVQINIMENKNLAVFVSPNGNDDNPGTRALPVRSLLTAYSMAASGGADVYLAGGIHHLTTTLTLVDGVSLFGGFRESDWARAGDAGSITTIDVGAPTAILASNINSATLLDVLIINSGDSPSQGGSTYGIRVSNSLGLILSHCDINAGKGGDGTSGTPHTSAAAAGGQGGTGQAGCESSSGLCSTCAQPYGGGGGTSAAGNPGGTGGRPRRGTNTGNPGLPGTGPAGGIGGTGTPPFRGDWNTDQSFWGANGGNGSNGTNGSAGMEGDYNSGGYLTIGGGDGSEGTAGSGGGGGGGGGGGDDGCDSYGGGGGGGGGGGAGGLGGEGGHSGGGSFAVYLWASQVVIQDCNLATEGSGRGGNGSQGQQGGNGGLGGRYPQGSTSGKGNPYGGSGEQDDGSNGARGGDGGMGGRGGYGGGGAGGPSIGVLIAGGSTADLTSTSYSIGSAGAGGSGGNSGPAGPRHNTYIP